MKLKGDSMSKMAYTLWPYNEMEYLYQHCYGNCEKHQRLVGYIEKILFLQWFDTFLNRKPTRRQLIICTVGTILFNFQSFYNEGSMHILLLARKWVHSKESKVLQLSRNQWS